MAETKSCDFVCDVIVGAGCGEAFGVLVVLYEVRVAYNSAGEGARNDGAVREIVGDLLVDPGGRAIHGVQAKVIFVGGVGDQPSPC